MKREMFMKKTAIALAAVLGLAANAANATNAEPIDGASVDDTTVSISTAVLSSAGGHAQINAPMTLRACLQLAIDSGEATRTRTTAVSCLTPEGKRLAAFRCEDKAYGFYRCEELNTRPLMR